MHAERDRKLEEARKQQQIRRQTFGSRRLGVVLDRFIRASPGARSLKFRFAGQPDGAVGWQEPKSAYRCNHASAQGVKTAVATGHVPERKGAAGFRIETVPDAQGDVTQLLAQWTQGDRAALDAATGAVYAELRKIAEGYFRREHAQPTLQPTALIHEAWIRLAKEEHASFENRRQFYAFAARLMRQVLVDHARSAAAEKRGGGVVKVPLDELIGAQPTRTQEFLALDEALDNLARWSPRKAQVIELRHFGGLNVEETAETLGVSIATVSREQRMAEAWLSQALSPSADRR